MTIRQRLMRLESTRKDAAPVGGGKRKLLALIDSIAERRRASNGGADPETQGTPEERAAEVEAVTSMLLRAAGREVAS